MPVTSIGWGVSCVRLRRRHPEPSFPRSAWERTDRDALRPCGGTCIAAASCIHKERGASSDDVTTQNVVTRFARGRGISPPFAILLGVICAILYRLRPVEDADCAGDGKSDLARETTR